MVDMTRKEYREKQVFDNMIKTKCRIIQFVKDYTFLKKIDEEEHL